MTNTENANSFKDLNLSIGLHKALEKMGYKDPTPIQSQAIPVALLGKDIIGCAQTGTGKTAAFCIPTISKLETNKQGAALILVPTREIAEQISKVLLNLTIAMPEMRIALLIGGADMFPQLRALAKKPRIVVATPGRLLDHVRRKSINLSKTEVLILDEADRMLDMGFAPQLNEVLNFLPDNRQTMLFSATMPFEILKLASKYLTNPVRITIGEISKPIEKIEQTVIHVTAQEKNDKLLDELNTRQGSVLIFTRTKKRTDRVAKFLYQSGHEVGLIHGDRSQAQRRSALEGFRRGKYRILVATDIAARGIDVPNIAHVINFDLPECAEDYVHRIGRTARAGAEGQALSILTPEDNRQWRLITRMISDGGHDHNSDERRTFGRHQGNRRPGGNSRPGSRGRPSFGRRDDRRADGRRDGGTAGSGRPSQRFSQGSRPN